MKIRLFTFPNLLTLMNLLCGAAAAVEVLVYHDYVLAFALIVLAAVFDFFDGFAARLLHQSSPIGLQLDSLADVVSFGFAPAAVMFRLVWDAPAAWFGDGGSLAWAALVLAAFSALRLAKFNIDDTQRTEFCGLPTPAAALFCASLGLLRALEMLQLPAEAVLLATFVLSALLVSPVRMFALKFHGFGWRGNELRYGFIGVSAVLIFTLGAYAIPTIIVLYVVVSTVRWAAQCARGTAKD